MFIHADRSGPAKRLAGKKSAGNEKLTMSGVPFRFKSTWFDNQNQPSDDRGTARFFELRFVGTTDFSPPQFYNSQLVAMLFIGYGFGDNLK